MGQIKLAQVIITYDCNKNCEYCFAENQKGYIKDMTLKDYSELLDWFDKNGIKSFNLTGGEPTIHPNIKEFLEIAYKRNFIVNIFSNGLFPEQDIDYFDRVHSFLINYNPETHYNYDEYSLLHKNLTNISKKNIIIHLMFNITEKIDSCKHIVKACKKYNVKEVILDLIIPNSLKSNQFIDKELFADKKKILLNFIKELKEIGVNVKISRPMPRCLFTKKEVFDFKKQGIVYFKCGTSHSILAVNPDLSAYPCLSVYYNGPKITSFPDIKAYNEFYNKSVNTLRWKRLLYEKCKSCIYHSRRTCQGACLCHKAKKFYVKKSKHFVIYSQHHISRIKEFIKSVEESVTELDKIFGQINGKIRIYLFDNKEDLLFYSGAYHYPRWVSGFASQNLTYYQYGAKSHERITHELCHLYIQYFSMNKIPTWLNEGFCEYVNFKDKEGRRELLNLMMTKELVPFKELSDCGHMGLLKYDSDPLNRNICYHQAHDFVRCLINKLGQEAVMRLILEKYDNFYERFKRVTGKDFIEFEGEWLESVKNSKSKK